jgi:deoxyribodipyrimidine photolyase-related protein
MSEAVIIFPHQLFKNNPALQAGKPVYLVEEWLFFRQYNFHQHKILLHRSSMKFYEDYLVTQNCAVHYIDSNDALHEVGALIAHLARQQMKRIAIVDVADNWLLKRIIRWMKWQVFLQVKKSFFKPIFTPGSVSNEMF